MCRRRWSGEAAHPPPEVSVQIPDAFAKLERWSNMRRKDQESVAEMLVREDELFRELQQSLKRSRDLQARPLPRPPKRTVETPMALRHLPRAEASPKKSSSEPEVPGLDATSSSRGRVYEDYSGNELRGYSLLKASRISVQERQQVFTLTSNRVNFEEVRQRR